MSIIFKMELFKWVKKPGSITFQCKENPLDTAIIEDFHHLSTVNYEEYCRNL